MGRNSMIFVLIFLFFLLVWWKSNLITGDPRDCSGQLPTYLKRFWLLPSRVSCMLLCPSLLLLLLLCCILLLLVDLSQVMWGPSRHLGSFTAANWVSFGFNVSYSSCGGYSLINTLKLKKSWSSKSITHCAQRASSAGPRLKEACATVSTTARPQPTSVCWADPEALARHWYI